MNKFTFFVCLLLVGTCEKPLLANPPTDAPSKDTSENKDCTRWGTQEKGAKRIAGMRGELLSFVKERCPKIEDSNLEAWFNINRSLVARAVAFAGNSAGPKEAVLHPDFRNGFFSKFKITPEGKNDRDTESQTSPASPKELLGTVNKLSF